MFPQMREHLQTVCWLFGRSLEPAELPDVYDASYRHQADDCGRKRQTNIQTADNRGCGSHWARARGRSGASRRCGGWRGDTRAGGCGRR
jgi:hypothetical protein